MNIYRHELRSYIKSTLTWVVSLCAVTAMFFSIFPAFEKTAGDMISFFKGFPLEVQNAFGFPIDLIGTIPGYYSFILTYIILCGGIQAMNIGLSVLGKEGAGKTSDFLLTKPVTRVGVLNAKLAAALTHIVVTSALYLLIASVMALAFQTKEFDYTPFLLMSLTFFYVQLIFLALGFLVASIVPKIRSMLPVSLGTVFGFFILGMVAAALEEEKLYYLSPFRYFDPAHIIQYHAYEMPYLAVGAAFIVLAVIVSYAVYTKKDIHAA